MRSSRTNRRPIKSALVAATIAAAGAVVIGGFLLNKPSGTSPAISTTAAIAAPPVRPASALDAGSRLVTGKSITPQGKQTNVGSYPTTLCVSPDGKWIAVSSLGARTQVSILSAQTGALVSQIGFNDNAPPPPSGGRAARQSLYVGLLWGKTENGAATLYASRGAEDKISLLSVDATGKVTDTGAALSDPAPKEHGGPYLFAGLAATGDYSQFLVAANTGDPNKNLDGTVRVLSAPQAGGVASPASGIATPGFPIAVALLTTGPQKKTKGYVLSEQAGGVTVLDMAKNRAAAQIPTGAQPTHLLLNRAQTRLYVSNAGSDTISVLDTKTDKIVQTLLVRPAEARGLPSATPLGIALSPDEKTLFVALADLNAVAVVDAQKGQTRGYVPAGWYPTDVAVSRDDARLFVSNAKGVQARNPNAKPVAVAGKDRPQYIQNIIEGTVSTMELKTVLPNLPHLTRQTLVNNAVGPNWLKAAQTALRNPGIQHIIYIIKENRTYDQVFGDIVGGNGDPALVLFGSDVTPNQHALAQRFVLLDNFYCCAEVSSDGWNWSTSGMANEFVSRNTVYSYTGHPHSYDFEGTNNGQAPDRIGKTDVARAPGGYLWDKTIAAKIPTRNYGFFMDDLELPRQLPESGTTGLQNTPTKRALIGHFDSDFRYYDINYADGDAYEKHNIPPFPKRLLTYGAHKSMSRAMEWRREFDGFVKNKKLPRFSMMRLGNDHTAGTSPGMPSPRAMVADNDYAVGQIVEAVSHSPYWKNTAIFIVEDDAQNGYDHVDAHRSIAQVISPFVRQATIDHRFYNTDSTLRTMELLLGVSPMTLYDAIAPPIAVFSARPENNAPYAAILPDKAILSEVNTRTAYRAAFSATLARFGEESEQDEQLNDVLWHAIKGRDIPAPPRHYGLSVAPPPGTPKAVRRDDDD